MNSIVAQGAMQDAAQNATQNATQDSPQKTLTAKELSDSLYKEFQSKDFKGLKTIPLTAAAFDNFPYNIEIDFNANEPSNEDFIIVASQEDLQSHKDFFKGLLDFAARGGTEFNLNFIFTAGDKRKIDGNEKTTGTEVFCKAIEGAQNKQALILDFGARKKNYIMPGSTGQVAPFYLVKNLCDTLDENSIGYAITGGIYLSLYNLGILKTDVRIASFLGREIPAVMLNLLSTKDDYSAELMAVKSFILKIDDLKTKNWSHHYIPIKLATRHAWITEKHIIMVFVLFSTVALLVLSDFMFLFRRRRRVYTEIKLKALKSNYLIFLTAAILTVSLYAGQVVAQLFQRIGVYNFLLLFIIKISLPFFTITALYPIEIKINKNLPTYIYEYILTISALINVFLFTMIDISLFFLFALEYLVLALSRTVKRTFFLYVFMAAFLIPFIPLLYSILMYTDMRKLFSLIFCSLSQNIILSFALVPLCLLWMRVLVRLKLKSYSTRKTVLIYLGFSLIALAGIATLSAISVSILNKLFFKNIEFRRPFAQVQNADQNKFTDVSIYDTEYYGGKIRRIELSSSKQPERYAIFIEGESKNPIYFSFYDTAFENNRTEFLLPENPPKNLTILYSPNSSENSIIRVESYFLEDEAQNQRRRAVCKKESFAFNVYNGEISEQKAQ